MHVHVKSCTGQGTSNVVTNDKPSNECEGWALSVLSSCEGALCRRSWSVLPGGVWKDTATDGCSPAPLATKPPALCSHTHWQCSLAGIWSIFSENVIFIIGFCQILSRQVVWPAFSNLTLSEVHSYSGRDVCTCACKLHYAVNCLPPFHCLWPAKQSTHESLLVLT